MSSRRDAVSVGLVVAALVVSACSGGGKPDILVSDARVGATTAEAAGLYLDLANTGDASDALVGVSCECAEQASMHTTTTTNGLSIMVQTDELEIPAEETVSLAPGAAHVMLEQLNVDLAAGTTIELALDFSSSKRQAVQARVVDLASLAGDVGDGR
jgi:copper(I)-binding protein